MKRLSFVCVALGLWAVPVSAQEAPEPSGSPAWFNGNEFFAGWGVAWSLVGPMLIYWFMKRSADKAIE